MAHIVTILNALTTEIRLAVTGIVPNDKASERFHTKKELEKQNIREQSGTPRLFEVTWETPQQMDGGHTQKTWDVPGSITIGYPVQTDWNIARAGDVQQVFDTLNQTDSSVTGCEFRHVPQGEDPEIEEAEDDWIWMIVPTRAVITTS